MRIPILDRDYIIDWLEETAWIVLTSVGAVVLPIILATDIELVEDWRLWVTALGVAALRITIATIGNRLQRLLGRLGTSSDTT